MDSVHPHGGPKAGLPDAWPEAVKKIPWLMPHFATADGKLLMSIHSLLVETPEARLIVDTCVGNDKPRLLPIWNKLGSDFLGDLERAGWPRASVDGVLCTHLHVDHVGWNTMLENGRWVPTFHNAKYYMAKSEMDYWSQATGRMGTRAADSRFVKVMMDTEATIADSVQPIVAAGLATLVACDAQIMPGVRLIPTPGHTPGHVSVVLESRGERAVITGDMMHHPCQIARPEWSAAFDIDSPCARATRRDFLAAFSDAPTLIIGTHFGGATAGRLLRDGNDYRLEV